MTKLTIFLAAACLVTAVPLVAADETKADCEDNVTWMHEHEDKSLHPHPQGAQPWIGYTTSAPVQGLVEDLNLPVKVRTCEGEHWDGQDNVSSNAPGQTAPCSEVDVADPSTPFVGNCMNVDPNVGGSDALGLKPLAFRIGAKDQGSAKEAYIGLDIFSVGRAVVYVGSCQGGGAGLEGDATCDGASQERVGIYLRDNTVANQGPNVLATAVSAPGITKGYVSETDCDQGTYQQGAMTNNRNLCGRDNTAITVEALIP